MTNPTLDNKYADEKTSLSVLTLVLDKLSPLDTQDRIRVISTILTFFGLNQEDAQISKNNAQPSNLNNNSRDNLTPKQFIMEKQPKTDVERIACLAYYLTHFRQTPHFKTVELSKLNTEAAQPRISNPTKSAGNAATYGYLAMAEKGNRQLSGPGELFVQNLPNREAAKTAMFNAKPRKTKTIQAKKKVTK